MAATDDLCYDILLELGWLPGEARCRDEDGTEYWQVDATRFDDGQVVVARAESKPLAWALCVLQRCPC